jgi:hypothetical protein
MRQRKARLLLRDKLARLQEQEARISRGLRLLVGDPGITELMFEVYRDTGDAARAVTGFVNHELDPEKAVVKHGTVQMRVIAPRDPEIRMTHHISPAQVSSILALKAERNKRYGPTRYQREQP